MFTLVAYGVPPNNQPEDPQRRTGHPAILYYGHALSDGVTLAPLHRIAAPQLDTIYSFRVVSTKAGQDQYRSHQFKQPTPIRGATQGIIAFTWEGPFNAFSATGHMDLYRGLLTVDPQTLGANCIGEPYFNVGPMIADFWEVRP